MYLGFGSFTIRIKKKRMIAIRLTPLLLLEPTVRRYCLFSVFEYENNYIMFKCQVLILLFIIHSNTLHCVPQIY